MNTVLLFSLQVQGQPHPKLKYTMKSELKHTVDHSQK